jgi:hypothetical protein
MLIIGCDLHARQLTLAILNTDTGEVEERVLEPPCTARCVSTLSATRVVHFNRNSPLMLAAGTWKG